MLADAQYIFLDSNALLHFLRPDQVDWAAFTGSSTVRLIIAPVVLRELEHQKVFHRSKRIRERAQGIIKWLSPFIDVVEPSAIRTGTTIQFVRTEPSIDFSEYKLSPQMQDDQLIATATQFMKEKAVSARIFTADTGLRVKLAVRDVKALVPSEEWRLPNDLTEEELAAAKAKQELQRLQNRKPELELLFDDGKTECVLGFDPFNAARMRAERPTGFAFVDTNRWYEYERDFAQWRTLALAVGSFKITIRNCGTGIATSIYVRVDLPEGVRAVPEPVEPQPPGDFTTHTPLGLSFAEDPVVSKDERSISFTVDSLSHNRENSFEPVYLAFDRRDAPERFAAHCTIKCNELFEPKIVELTFDSKFIIDKLK